MEITKESMEARLARQEHEAAEAREDNRIVAAIGGEHEAARVELADEGRGER